MNWLTYATLYSVAASYLLWVMFLAVMKLRDIKDAGKLGGAIKYPAYLTLAIGYVLDALVNIVVLTVLFLELPHELTVSERTKRLALTEPDAWRGKFSQWLRTHFLSAADNKGGHD